jgi:hypothetical protein
MAYTHIFNMTKGNSLLHYFFTVTQTIERHYIHTEKTGTGLLLVRGWSVLYPHKEVGKVKKNIEAAIDHHRSFLHKKEQVG